MCDRPGEQEVERRAAALARDVLDDAAERIAADEERECLVLVRRPGHQLVEQECGCRRSSPQPRLRAARGASQRA